MRRRTLLQALLSTVAALPARLRGHQTPGPADEVRIRAVADAVLPQEIGAAGIDAAAAAFLRWVRDYRADAEIDAGYGLPRLRRTPASPAASYPAQLDALETHARGRGRSFADLSREDRRLLIEAAIAAAAIERLPARPNGGHVATDLMAHYFHSIDANDVAYRARIGRDTCRTLEGSGERPAPLPSGGR